MALAHFDNCDEELALAHSLGIIAIEMLQNGICPPTDEELVLKDPDNRWSSEVKNFLAVASWATLKEMHDVRCLSIFIVNCFNFI
jgi:hypothetical protein